MDLKKARRIFRSGLLAKALCAGVLFSAAFLPVAAQNATKITVTGQIVDGEGLQLAGAIVVVTGDKAGTSKANVMADINGKYSITCLTTDQLEFHYIGYQDKVEKVNGRSKIDVVMLPDASVKLDEAVVIGYGSVRKADVTGSVTSVKIGDVQDVPVASVDEALQGRVAGADIMTTTGDPGATTSIRIRGTRSITASNDPLIVVDGVMDAVHDLNDLNVADIEDIVFLKDASSTAIYGSRGANGVILITTKTGQSSSTPKTWVTFKAEAGFSELPRKLDIMNAREFAVYRNNYTMNGSTAKQSVPVSELSVADPFSYGKGTDWIGAITRRAPYQNYYLSVSGSSKGTKYFVSVGYNDNEGIIRKSAQKRMSNNVNLTQDVFKWLKIYYKLSYTYRRNYQTLANVGGTAWHTSAQYLSPLIGKHDNYNPLYYSGQLINTPVSTIEQNTYYLDRHFVNQNITATAKFKKVWELKSQFGYFLYERHTYRYYPSTLPKKKEGEGGEAYRGDYNEYKLSSETSLTFNKTWRKTHHLDAVAVFSGTRFRTHNFTLSGSGYMEDANKWNAMGAVLDKNTYSAATSTSLKNTMSFVGRFNYNYRQRYYLTMSGRYDGASNFASNRKWGFFPSAALKWNISKEKFLRRNKAIDELSLRLSVGQTGNDAIGAYTSLAALTSVTNGYLFEGQQPVAFYPSRIASPNLTWEKTTLYNAALKGEFFNGRFKAELEAYDSRTTDLLLSVKMGRATGFASRYANLGETSNKGIEFSLDTRNIVRKNFSWSTSFTIAHNKQKVINIGSEEYVATYNAPGNNSYMMCGYVKGYPINAMWGFKYAGVWKNADMVARNKVTRTYASQTSSQSLGTPKYIDVNHDGTLNMDDLCYLGNADPYIYGGLQNNFRYKNLSLKVYFTYSLGGKIYNYSEFYMAGGTLSNQYRYMLNGWSAYRNPDSNLPRAGYYESALPSDFMLHDASYLRLQNVSLSYVYPFKNKKILRDLTFTVSGTNLYLWKNYNGFDPDVSTEANSRRMDVGAYPRARKIVFTIQVRY